MLWLKKVKYILVVSSFLIFSCKEEVEQVNVDHEKNFLNQLNHDDTDSLLSLYQNLEFDSLFKVKYPAVKLSQQLEFYFPSVHWKKEISNQLALRCTAKESTNKYEIWISKEANNTYFLYNYPPDTNIVVLEIYK